MRLMGFRKRFGAFVLGLALVSGLGVATASSTLFAGEVVIGQKQLSGGIELIFEAAPADAIEPAENNLTSGETDVHIECRANFTSGNSFASAEGGFVGYLNVNVMIVNQVTGEKVKATLLPHLNLIDGFHYARNVDVPGKPKLFKRAKYDMTFWINPPDTGVVSIHTDFGSTVNPTTIIDAQTFTFTGVNFAEVFSGVASGSGSVDDDDDSTPEHQPTSTPTPTPTPTPDDDGGFGGGSGSGGGGGSGSGLGGGSGSGGGGSGSGGGGSGSGSISSVDSNSEGAKKKRLRIFF